MCSAEIILVKVHVAEHAVYPEPIPAVHGGSAFFKILVAFWVDVAMLAFEEVVQIPNQPLPNCSP